ncbi:single-stranded-DNA-specific exonuclease [Litorivivens lipolytica]|uniref:Single-stranded-DNA-specific exonuclease RecJ n=1 Tax=Litorivivens lipolytica TaxID=1524264 RepID=A0A7W4W1R4_9GAMM|nr:single-stranded-DNA-specific exonuclease RecJ [Litorivivens lipolytica]MBB3045866.1 single-stranded-DNA-specific exonuclease [Litorivivens lipolytica]
MSLNIQRRQAALDQAAFSDAIPPLLQRIYAARGVFNDSDCDLSLTHLLPPTCKGLEAAVARLVKALENDERILIVGDFDADGATSSALGMKVLRAFDARQVDFLVPNRFEYGYGLSPEIVAVAAESKPDLIVTVDNGISSLAGVDAANALGMDVVITDHHLPGSELPKALAIVNPNQPGCPFPSKALAGVGVMFYLLVALRAALNTAGWFKKQGIAPPKMADYLDLVALGTVADVVPLDHNNRILVHQGIRRIRAGLASPGIYALLEAGKRDPNHLQAADLGFVVGPRLNAAGRLDDMSLGIRCLLAEDPDKARELAGDLDRLNRERREIEQGMQQEALSHLENLQLNTDVLASGELPLGITLHDDTWHPGVVGLVASRIKERFHRPVIAFAPEDDEIVKGSGRSIPGVHIRDVLDSVDKRCPGAIVKFGGHAMAAGLSLKRDRLQDFSEAFAQVIDEQSDPELFVASLVSDGELGAGDLNEPLARQLLDAGPWGQHFPEPRFDGEFLLLNQRIVGEKHLKFVVAPLSNPQQAIDAIAFNIDVEQWPNPDVRRVRLYYALDINRFRGNEQLQLMVQSLEAV